MITFEKAHEIVVNNACRCESEKIPFGRSLGRILSSDIVSDIDMPPFDRSSVDGFACRKAETGEELEIIETIPAGAVPSKILGPLQCSRIMTGAKVPQGADCVVMVEETVVLQNGKMKFTGVFKKENIAFKGEDVKIGDTVLKAPRIVKPQDIAVMAATGSVIAEVSSRPRLAVISSGDELVEPHEVPSGSRIRNSNASQILAQAERAGAIGKYYGIAGDDEKKTLEIVTVALEENDIVIITGGVSMGDFDFVPAVLERAGVKILFSKVSVQPGKPTTFGTHPNGVVFGLPGNPVSSFTQFELLVRPLIYKMMGLDWKPVNIVLPIEASFSRRYAERMAWIPVKISERGTVIPVEYHGSAHISALSDADGLIPVASGVKTIEKGELVSVRQI